jgi:hypothetical protein
MSDGNGHQPARTQVIEHAAANQLQLLRRLYAKATSEVFIWRTRLPAQRG